MTSFIPVTAFISTHPDLIGPALWAMMVKGSSSGPRPAMISIMRLSDFRRQGKTEVFSAVGLYCSRGSDQVRYLRCPRCCAASSRDRFVEGYW